METKSFVRLLCYYMPHSRNKGFVGREETLLEIQRLFNASTDGQHAVALSGLGGIGKTQISLEYLYRHRPE